MTSLAAFCSNFKSKQYKITGFITKENKLFCIAVSNFQYFYIFDGKLHESKLTYWDNWHLTNVTLDMYSANNSLHIMNNNYITELQKCINFCSTMRVWLIPSHLYNLFIKNIDKILIDNLPYYCYTNNNELQMLKKRFEDLNVQYIIISGNRNLYNRYIFEGKSNIGKSFLAQIIANFNIFNIKIRETKFNSDFKNIANILVKENDSDEKWKEKCQLGIFSEENREKITFKNKYFITIQRLNGDSFTIESEFLYNLTYDEIEQLTGVEHFQLISEEGKILKLGSEITENVYHMLEFNIANVHYTYSANRYIIAFAITTILEDDWDSIYDGGDNIILDYIYNIILSDGYILEIRECFRNEYKIKYSKTFSNLENRKSIEKKYWEWDYLKFDDSCKLLFPELPPIFNENMNADIFIKNDSNLNEIRYEMRYFNGLNETVLFSIIEPLGCVDFIEPCDIEGWGNSNRNYLTSEGEKKILDFEEMIDYYSNLDRDYIEEYIFPFYEIFEEEDIDDNWFENLLYKYVNTYAYYDYYEEFEYYFYNKYYKKINKKHYRKYKK